MRAIVTDGLAEPSPRDPGPKPEMKWLPVSLLVVDPDYQRDVNKSGRRQIEKIAAAFEWTKFSAVVVAPVSLGRYAIIDGQHRVTAAKLAGIQNVPCLIQLLDRSGQAAAFSAINGAVTKITPNAMYKAALAAGEGWAVVADRTCKNAGVRLMTSNRSAAMKNGGEIYAALMMRDAIDRHGEAAVTLALTAYKRSVYGDLAIAWASPLLVAWMAAVATTKGATGRPASDLAAFHENFDMLEHADRIAAESREARKRGESPAGLSVLLSYAIAEALEDFMGAKAAA